MDRFDALPGEMLPTAENPSDFDPLSLDPSVASRLFDGLSVDDAPASYAPVAKLLAAANGPTLPHELAGEAEAMAAFTAVGPRPSPSTATRRNSLLTRMKTRKFAVAAAIGGFSLFTGLTAAGALPGAAQQAAADALAKVGITVPSPNSHAGDHPGSRGKSGDHKPSDAGTDATTPTTTKGSEISNLARTTQSTGVDKGAEISTTASNGKSQAGADHSTTGDAGAEHATTSTVPTTSSTTVPPEADGGVSHKPNSHP